MAGGLLTRGSACGCPGRRRQRRAAAPSGRWCWERERLSHPHWGLPVPVLGAPPVVGSRSGDPPPIHQNPPQGCSQAPEAPQHPGVSPGQGRQRLLVLDDAGKETMGGVRGATPGITPTLPCLSFPWTDRDELGRGWGGGGCCGWRLKPPVSEFAGSQPHSPVGPCDEVGGTNCPPHPFFPGQGGTGKPLRVAVGFSPLPHPRFRPTPRGFWSC